MNCKISVFFVLFLFVIPYLFVAGGKDTIGSGSSVTNVKTPNDQEPITSEQDSALQKNGIGLLPSTTAYNCGGEICIERGGFDKKTKYKNIRVRGTNIRMNTNGSVESWDSLVINDYIFLGRGRGFTANEAGDFFVRETESYSDSIRKVVDARDIGISASDFWLRSAGAVQENNAVLADVRSYHSSQLEFSVSSAKSISISGRSQNFLFSNIADSRFVLDTGRSLKEFSVSSAAQGNVFELPPGVTIIADKGEDFKAELGRSRDGSALATVTSSDSIDIISTAVPENQSIHLVLNQLFTNSSYLNESPLNTSVIAGLKNRTTQALDSYLSGLVPGNSTVLLSEDGAVLARLAPDSRFISYNSRSVPFSVYVPRFAGALAKNNSYVFSIYFAASAERNCSQCMVIDYDSSSIYANGIFEYEMLGSDNRNFVDVIQSYSADNRFAIKLAPEQNKIAYINYTGYLAYFKSGAFVIKKQAAQNYFRFAQQNIPYYISRLGNIQISDSGVLLEKTANSAMLLYDTSKEQGTEFMKKWAWIMQHAAELAQRLGITGR